MPNEIRVIDLFAGVGGIRRGFEDAAAQLGATVKCVFTSEWDKFAKQTYQANYPHDDHEVLGDITAEAVQAEIPPFDVLLAGFPCQPFSLAGVSKKNSLGRPHGFADPTQGTLFHEIVKIIRQHQPAAFFLENVKHLERHDGGRTFKVITEALNDLGYVWSDGVVNASTRVPQNRERIFLVGYRADLGISPRRPALDQHEVAIQNILHEHHIDDRGKVPSHNWPSKQRGLADYTLTPRLWQYLQDYRAKHEAKGNGFGFGLVDNLDGITRTLSARYHKDGSEILIPQSGNQRPRRLTPRECARLQGYPESFQIVCSDTQAYRQFGNSVAVPVIRDLATPMLRDLVKIPADILRRTAMDDVA